MELGSGYLPARTEYFCIVTSTTKLVHMATHVAYKKPLILVSYIFFQCFFIQTLKIIHYVLSLVPFQFCYFFLVIKICDKIHIIHKIYTYIK